MIIGSESSIPKKGMRDKNLHKCTYPSIPSSTAALYWKGISMSAARANDASFSDEVLFLFIISVKLTNYIHKQIKMYLDNNTYVC